MKKMKVGFHGEVIAVSITKLPENLKTIRPCKWLCYCRRKRNDRQSP